MKFQPKLHVLTLSLALLLIPTGPFRAHASTLTEQFFKELSKLPEHFENQGRVCELIAALNLEEKYPKPRYEIQLGLFYLDQLGQQKGEVDLVVFDTRSEKAILVGEVKCWADPLLPEALSKAHEQLDRFYDLIQSERWMMIVNPVTRVHLDRRQFKKLTRLDYKTIAQDFGLKLGFDLSFGLTLEEVSNLRNDLLECQKDGPCLKPPPIARSKSCRSRKKRSRSAL